MLSFPERLLTPTVARATAVALLIFYAVVAVLWWMSIHNGIDWSGESYGGDFIIFWGAAKLAAVGEAVAAYPRPVLDAAHAITWFDLPHYHMQQTAIPRVSHGMIWVYPPTNLLMVSWLGRLSYGVGWFAWWIGTGALYLWMVRGFSRDAWAPLLAAAFPGAFITAYCGQNGFLTAALLGGGLLLLDRRPIIAGVLIGLMAFKPQLALLAPFLLAFTGRWRAFGAAAVTGVLFVGLSASVYGVDAWRAFLTVLPHVQDTVVHRNVPVFRMPSVFVTATWMGASREMALLIWAAVAVPVGAATVWAWRLTAPHALKVGLAASAALIVTPYCWNYDLVLLAIPAAAMMEHARRETPPAGWKLTVLLIALTPFAFMKLNQSFGVQVMPIAMITIWAMSLRVLMAARVPKAQTAAPTRLEPAGEPALAAA